MASTGAARRRAAAGEEKAGSDAEGDGDDVVDEFLEFSDDYDLSDELGEVGCHCTRSQCLQKHCVCYKAGRACGPECHCVGCANTQGKRKLLRC
ncbi:MAG: TCR domain-containing protein, partial [Phycisphaerales bacterium]|nr:TCR domain-containing protein [Phycisphaerales bacterium]